MNARSAGRTRSGRGTDEKKRQNIPSLEDFISARDYTGAVTLLNFNLQSGLADDTTLPWLGYAAFHKGDYGLALSTYERLLQKENADPRYHLYSACCHFYLQDYKKAEASANVGPDIPLKTRILFHVAHRQFDSTRVMGLLQQLGESTEDQLSLASMHYLRTHFQESTDIYKRMLIDYREYLALQVYVALCYYKLDYYDVSNEILAPYLAKYPNSIIAVNLKAANQFRLFDGKSAENELKNLIELLSASSQNMENDLIRHNLVVYRKGANALQVLPPLVGVMPEARLNLVVYHLQNDNIEQAYELIKDLMPATPQEYILKAVVNAALGQMDESKRAHIDDAQNFFQLVGGSASECDTIPGRQCMASLFFLMKQFDDVLIYLNSIKAYMTNNDVFHYNYGIALAAADQFKEAEEALLMVTDERIKREYVYTSWLARCFIQNGHPRMAWELHDQMDNTQDTFAMLVLIANDCYKAGAFYYAAKGFDMLDRMDPSTEHWAGKRGACCGVFQQVIARKEEKSALRDVINMLQATSEPSPQAAFIVRVMIKWGQENGLDLTGLGP